MPIVISVVTVTTNEHSIVIRVRGQQGESGDCRVAGNGMARGGLMGPINMVATATTSPTE